MLWQNTEHLKQLKEKMMLHESIKQKKFTVKENDSYRMRVTQHEVLAPKGLYSLDFIQESLKDGEVMDSQTYNFFMTQEDLEVLCKGLLNG